MSLVQAQIDDESAQVGTKGRAFRHVLRRLRLECPGAAQAGSAQKRNPRHMGAFVINSASAADQTVVVKYSGPVNLAPFACEAITRSSFIENVCYDAKNTYMLIDLKGTWYHYCEIDQEIQPPCSGVDGAFLQRLDQRSLRLPHASSSGLLTTTRGLQAN